MATNFRWSYKSQLSPQNVLKKIEPKKPEFHMRKIAAEFNWWNLCQDLFACEFRLAAELVEIPVRVRPVALCRIFPPPLPRLHFSGVQTFPGWPKSSLGTGRQPSIGTEGPFLLRKCTGCKSSRTHPPSSAPNWNSSRLWRTRIIPIKWGEGEISVLTIAVVLRC